LRPVVRAAFVPFTSKFEGVCTWMYLDIKGLVTTGIGDLVDSPQDVLGLPWIHKATKAPATYQEIAQAWTTVKGATTMAKLGGGAFAGLTDLRLTPDGVAYLVDARLDSNNIYLAKRWPDFEQWPADAQMGAHSIAWAAGPGWTAPNFDRMVRAVPKDWAGIAGHMGVPGEAWLNDTGNPGLRPRNLANQALFYNAYVVQRDPGMDPSILYYPEHLT
jgi:hypothetical protein